MGGVKKAFKSLTHAVTSIVKAPLRAVGSVLGTVMGGVQPTINMPAAPQIDAAPQQQAAVAAPDVIQDPTDIETGAEDTTRKKRGKNSLMIALNASKSPTSGGSSGNGTGLLI